MVKRRRHSYLRIRDKRQAALIMRRALRNAQQSKVFDKMRLISVLLPFKSVAARNCLELESKIRQLSRGKECERIFIRGDMPRRINKNRFELWASAPRGNLDVKTGKLEWDTAPSDKSIGQYRFLLHETRDKSRIKNRGSLFFNFVNGNLKGKYFEYGKRMRRNIAFEREGIPKLGLEGRQLVEFMRQLKKTGLVSENFAEIRFIRWKGKKGIEIYDLDISRDSS